MTQLAVNTTYLSLSDESSVREKHELELDLLQQ